MTRMILKNLDFDNFTDFLNVSDYHTFYSNAKRLLYLIQSTFSAETHIYFCMDDWYSTIPTQPHFHKLKYIHLNSEYIFRELNSRGKYDICMLCGACQGLNWNASEDHTLDYLLYLPHPLVLQQPQRWKFWGNTKWKVVYWCMLGRRGGLGSM